jgi:exodeoxyribonuclease V alpha subunit
MNAMAPVDALFQVGALRTLDHALALSLARLRPDTPAPVLLAAALCSRALAQGHSCVPVTRTDELLSEIVPVDREWPPLPSTQEWLAALRASPWVFVPAEPKALAADATAMPATAATGVMVLEGDAISLRRYWTQEMAIAAALRSRLSEVARPADGVASATVSMPGEFDPAQARAAEVALGSRLLLLTGGPGTGKTRTVAAILALLAEQARGGAVALRIALAAPTGKAAARLAEAVREHAAGLSVSGQTLHRLLGISGDGRPPRFDASEPLPFDVVVVDEASMVDLPMMARLLAAVANDARLILVGDPDQLPSVDAGAVLSALCAAGSGSSLAACHVHLETSYRQTGALELSPLNAAIRAGDVDAAIERLADSTGLHWQRGGDAGIATFVREQALPWYRRIGQCSDLASALAEVRRFRVLTALRDGPAGSQTLNALIASELHPGPDAGAFFPGRLILISENSYRHGLYNGDIGLCWPDADGVLRVWFERDASDSADHGSGPRAWHPAQLPAHESAFALTVHKAQGSEFAQVLLVLPEHDARVISRELLYTGLGRGRERVLVWAGEPLLRTALARKMSRWSGLAARLQRPGLDFPAGADDAAEPRASV